FPDGAHLPVLQMFFGTDEIGFDVTSSRFPSEPRHYDRFSAALAEITEARIWAGLHFRTADVQAQNLGKNVADDMAENYFQPVGGADVDLRGAAGRGLSPPSTGHRADADDRLREPAYRRLGGRDGGGAECVADVLGDLGVGRLGGAVDRFAVGAGGVAAVPLVGVLDRPRARPGARHTSQLLALECLSGHGRPGRGRWAGRGCIDVRP